MGSMLKITSHWLKRKLPLAEGAALFTFIWFHALLCNCSAVICVDISQKHNDRTRFSPIKEENECALSILLACNVPLEINK